jgi:hypothetical protein
MDRVSVQDYLRNNKLRVFFFIVLSALYGIVAGGSILGFLRIYSLPLALLFCIGLGGLILYLLIQEDAQVDSLQRGRKPASFKGPDLVTALAGVTIFICLVLVPLIRWPLTPISNPLTWDAGLYHFPKAAEMISTGSAWDLTIAYGEYPFGYESLVAFALLLNHAGLFIGSAHALIALFLYLTLILILAERLRFPLGIIVLLTSILFTSYRFLPAFDSNIWSMLWSQLTLIGKNDLFLAASLLGILFFTPGARKGPFQPLGLAAVSMLALSIKPTSGIVVLAGWSIFFFFAAKSGSIPRFKSQILPAILIMAPGAVWIIRNLVSQRALFSPEVLGLSRWSIASNLFNPNFYNFIPPNFYIALAIFVSAALFSIRGVTRKLDVLFALVFLLSFIFSPASGFFGSTAERTQVAWRFAVAFLLVLYVLMMEILDHFAARSLEKWHSRRGVRWVIPILSVLLCAWGIWSQQSLLQTNVKRTVLLRDQFDHPVGSQGYYSAYDYVQKNVRNSTVIVENGLPFFLYDPGFTNSVTRSKPADYIVFIKFPNPDFSTFASRIDTPAWEQQFEIVYEDSQGRVYKRR